MNEKLYFHLLLVYNIDVYNYRGIAPYVHFRSCITIETVTPIITLLTKAVEAILSGEKM